MKLIALFALLAAATWGQSVFPPATGGSGSSAAGATGDVQCKASNGTLAACGANDNGATVSIPARKLSVGGALPGAAPAGTFSATISQSAAQLDVKAYGAKGDGILHYACTIGAGAFTLSCPSGTFASSESGKSIVVRGAGTAGAALRTTVDSVSSGVATLHNAAITALTGDAWQGAITGTDDTASIAAAIAALTFGMTLKIPAGIYLISSALSLDNQQSIEVSGYGYNRQATDFSSPQLMYTGSTGSLLTLKSVIGVKVAQLGLSYWDSTYSGNLIDVEQGSGGLSVEVSIVDCSIQGNTGVTKNAVSNGNGTQAGPAASLIYMNLVYDINIERCLFSRAQVAIQGPIGTEGTPAANIVRIRDNFFGGAFAKAPIQVFGGNWNIIANTFEPMDNGISDARTCGAIQASQVASGVVVIGDILVSGNTIEDAAKGAGICMDFNGSGAVFGASITGNGFQYGGTGVRGAPGRGWSISGNQFDHLTTAMDFGTGVSSNLLVNGIENSTLRGNSYTFVDFIIAGAYVSSAVDWDDTSAAEDGIALQGPMKFYSALVMAQGEVTRANRVCSGANRRGFFFVEQDGWTGTSDLLPLCIKANGLFQYITIPLGNYTPPVELTGQTASVGATNLQFGAGIIPAGLYQVSYYLNVTTGGAGATVALTLGWTDTAARTVSSTTVDASTTNYTSGTFTIKTDGSTNLTYATTLANSATYALSVSVTRVL